MPLSRTDWSYATQVCRTAILVLIAAMLLGACGEGGSGTDSIVAADDDGPQHVHGLGVDPADESLYIATHTGLWRAAASEQRARRVGDSYRDVMGFTVVGPKRFLGSGHPDARENLPPLLGLTASDDAGQSWTSVSLEGKADFHVLRFANGRIYGVDATSGQIMRSVDGGKSWHTLAPPRAVIDFALDRQDPNLLVASTERGLMRSTDGGRKWRPLNQLVGLLAWPEPHKLYLIAGNGRTHVSADSGRSFKTAGNIGGQPAAFANHGDELLVALHDSTIKHSTDGGRSWTIRATP